MCPRVGKCLPCLWFKEVAMVREKNDPEVRAGSGRRVVGEARSSGPQRFF